jgi:hypothetical protein
LRDHIHNDVYYFELVFLLIRMQSTRIFNRNNLFQNNSYDSIVEYPSVCRESIMLVDKHGNSVKSGIPPYSDVVLISGTLELAKITYDILTGNWKIHQYSESTIEGLNYQIMMYEFRLSNHVDWGGSEAIIMTRLRGILMKYRDNRVNNKICLSPYCGPGCFLIHRNQSALPYPEVVELMGIDELIECILAQITNGRIICDKEASVFRRRMAIRGCIKDHYYHRITCRNFACERYHIKSLKCAYVSKRCKKHLCIRRHRE